MTGTAAGTLNTELARLYEAGLLERERVGNQLRYWANRSHQIYPELAAILRKTVGLATVLLEASAPLAKKSRVAFVFGSIARGSESIGSDIDVMIIGSLSFGATVDALRKQRHLTEYTGEAISDATVAECVAQADALFATSAHWLASNRPNLL